MKEIEEIRQDIIDRYNLTWIMEGMTDTTGLVEEAKRNFETTVDKLIKAVRDYYDDDSAVY